MLTISYIKDTGCLEVSVLKDLVASERDFLSSLVRKVQSAVKKIVFSKALPSPHISSAERTGAAIFRNDLDFAMSKIVDFIREKEKTQGFNPVKLLTAISSSGYPIPVGHNVDFIRKLSTVELRKSFITEEYPYILDNFSDIIGGAYKSDKERSVVYYIPKTNKKERLTLAESSSCVRSLLDLYYYLKHVARKGELLMIDEPEMNLHPGNQRKLARLLASLISVGIRVYITTHSDYIVKELSTLIVLENNERMKEVLLKNKVKDYQNASFLDARDVRFYTARNCRGKSKKNSVEIEMSNIGKEFGIMAPIFDETIDSMNRIHDMILWS